MGGATLTGVVCWGRVHGGKHFPTDVIAGTMAGMGIGLLVPHLHRAEGEESPVWIGLAPVPGGQELSVSGAF